MLVVIWKSFVVASRYGSECPVSCTLGVLPVCDTVVSSLCPMMAVLVTSSSRPQSMRSSSQMRDLSFDLQMSSSQ